MQISEENAMLSALKKDNDLVAYEYFFKKYYKPLCNKACQMLEDTDKGIKTVQQLFIEVWKSRQYQLIQHSPGGFFYQLVYERCLQLREEAEKQKAACPPCQIGPALVPRALPHHQLIIAMER